jgi:glycosyltransferase involved in cell wall biosynthesis
MLRARVDSHSPTRRRGSLRPGRQPADDYYLSGSELVAYKRIDLAIDAFNGLGRGLVIIGSMLEMRALRARANSNIEFLRRQPFSELAELDPVKPEL